MKTLEERFWEKVNKKGLDDCWEWKACRLKAGYGSIGAKKDGKHINALAHRVSYEIHFGNIPKGMNICHHCDNPPCVNPVHLFLGTQADNLKDAANKMRTTIGERNPMAKLKEKEVSAIRNSSELQSALAERFGVCQAAISGIRNGHRWKHVK